MSTGTIPSASTRFNDEPDRVTLGTSRLFEEFTQIQSTDYVVLAYTPDSRKYAAHCVRYLSQRNIRHGWVAMKALVDDAFQDRLACELPDPTEFAGNLICVTLERDTMSHFEIFAALFSLYGSARTRVVRVISASDEFFTEGLSLSTEELSQRNAYLLGKVKSIGSFTFRTHSGTDLRINLDNRYEWISNRGVLRPGAFTILPPGEIATYPASVNGVLVADGAINCNVVSTLDMRLSEHPVYITIEDSVATDHHCSDETLSEFVADCFRRENARNVGELGFGTNRGISDFIAHNSHLNERHPGLHLGFGQHNQSPELVSYDTDIHLDLVTDGGEIHGDEGTIIDLKDFVPPRDIAHPKLMRDEDITGDCCSTGCRVLTL